MEYVPMNIANGVVPDSLATVYTVPADTTVMLKSIILVNKTANAVTVTCKIVVGSGGVELNLIPPDMSLGGKSKYDDNSTVSLPEGSVIKLDASAADSVDYIISGVGAT